jgi:TIR domain
MNYNWLHSVFFITRKLGLGVDCGLEDHGSEVRGCIMDFCDCMPDIEFGLRNGPQFCESCKSHLNRAGLEALVMLTRRRFEGKSPLDSLHAVITESIILRGKRYEKTGYGFDYDVALSFAGSDRSYAEEIAIALRRAGLEVLYDQFDQAELWGKNLHAYLTELYRLRARFCIVFLSEHYSRNRWTRVELQAALAREFEQGKEYVLPIRLDDSEVDGILPTRGFIEWKEETPDSIAGLVKKKLYP